ncbi:hypothetical protein Q1W73_07755 [Asticcacaulis sp. ZE23SCel15]|uniref:hypothetical protein n=1 Tax=Asticcacaulis sp. ZE23SCel15 TaxID=3059027 RepID=UPI00265E4DEE|nr:hypothetical protein [Asticcacaulis sp. ZE23SCel15]WKL58871.1 hypothetical protein Q1W73_07755 [Asticcacaulis sp. ZE23SCel15]
MNLKLMRLLATMIFVGLVAFSSEYRSTLWPVFLGFILLSLLDFLPVNDARRKALTIWGAGAVAVMTIGLISYNLRDHDFAATWQYLRQNWLITAAVIYLPVFILSCVGYAVFKRRRAS